MITAIVNISCDPRTVAQTAQDIADQPNVAAVYSVTGRIDLIAIVRASTLDVVPEVVTQAISSIPGVRETETHIAFRTYSRSDSDAGFAIGFPAAD